MKTVQVNETNSWREFFRATNLSVGVETALPWIDTNSQIARHISALVKGIMFSLARMGARISPRDVYGGQEFEPRNLGQDAFLFSHHSAGEGDLICRFKHSYRLGYFTFDSEGYAGFSKFARMQNSLDPAWQLPSDRAIEYLEAVRNEHTQYNVSKFPQPPITGVRPEPGYVLLPLQLIDDTVMRLSRGEPIEFYDRVVRETVALGRRCIVKRHPHCTNSRVATFLSEITELANIDISNASINELLPGAERVVVINSSVGLEALIYGRPVFSFGGSEYAPLTTQIENIESVSSAIAGPARLDEVRAAQFLLYFFEHFSVRSDDEPGILRKVQDSLSDLPLRHGWRIS